MAKMYTALGFDVFAASFLLGVQLAGFKLLGTVEHSEYGKATRQLNFPKLFSWQWNDLLHLDFAQVAMMNNRVDLMVNNVPCAPWSSARHNKALKVKKTELWKDDERIDWGSDAAMLGRLINVKAWVWESIIPTWQHGRAFVDWQARQWFEKGYSTSVILQNNLYTWGTQNRKRMFMIAHTYPLVLPTMVTEPYTTDELLADVHAEKNEKRWLKEERAVLWKYSEKYHGSFARTQKSLRAAGTVFTIGSQSFLDYRLMGNVPPRVFLSDSTRMHPHEARYFTWHEMLALCGLPMTWQSAARSMNDKALELSRAVLPGVGQWLAEMVKGGLRLKPLAQQEAWIYDLRNPDEQRMERWVL